jgi:hypothetical protein
VKQPFVMKNKNCINFHAKLNNEVRNRGYIETINYLKCVENYVWKDLVSDAFRWYQQSGVHAEVQKKELTLMETEINVHFFVEGVWAWTTFQALRYIYPQVIFRFSCMLKPGRTTRSDKSTHSELFSSYKLITQ